MTIINKKKTYIITNNKSLKQFTLNKYLKIRKQNMIFDHIRICKTQNILMVILLSQNSLIKFITLCLIIL